MSRIETVTSFHAEAPASRRELILRESAKLFCEKGYSTTTVRDIANQVSILSGSIFYHFPSKAHILAEVIAEGMRYGEGVIRQAVAEAPPGAGDRFEVLLRAHLTLLLEETTRYSHYVAIREWKQLPEELRSPLRKSSESYRKLWWEVIDDLDKEGLLRVRKNILYRFCIGGLNWTAQWCTDRSPKTINELAREYRKLVLCE